MSSHGEHWDVIIVGGGPGGLSAALWCAELGLSTLLVENSSQLGGQLHNIYNPIENYIGLRTGNGVELIREFLRSVEGSQFTRMLKTEARRILPDTTIELGDGSTVGARAIIVATGVRRRRLGIDGEDDFRDNGILGSGVRDREKVRGKSVVIVGGGDAAFENAVILSDVAKQVSLAFRRATPTARDEFIQRLAGTNNVEFLPETTVERIGGESKVEWVETRSRSSGDVRIQEADAVLIRIGVEPNNELVRELVELDDRGYVRIDANCRTSNRNIFAIGDLANPDSPTIATAAGNGATAAKIIYCSLKQ